LQPRAHRRPDEMPPDRGLRRDRIPDVRTPRESETRRLTPEERLQIGNRSDGLELSPIVTGIIRRSEHELDIATHLAPSLSCWVVGGGVQFGHSPTLWWGNSFGEPTSSTLVICSQLHRL